jgi:heterodisulfide reductase subunit C
MCASCLQCTARCPKGLDIARIMEAIRLVILRKKERLDRLEVAELSEDFMERVPQIALISGFRKFTS